MSQRKYILTIAGHDPSGGAGVTSDIKTFEAHGLYGLSVCTAITIQNDSTFKSCTWINEETILAQIEILFNHFEIGVVKIGIVQSWSVVLKILEKLVVLNPCIKIILDPILKASAGYDFHSNEDQSLLDNIWKQCYLVTPNYNEIQRLYPEKSIKDTIEHICRFTNIYLKGGHRAEKKGMDELYYNEIMKITMLPHLAKVSEKHGSGCVLSAALASNICLGIALEDACRYAKNYTEQFLISHPSLLGTHPKNLIE
ncbi:hydroxymethylpyrimidine/phosphomethylpyrimidine kinase [Gelidibacter sp. F2691]|nr:hydroxymethylpyrimidine/phosphomethylpyrimidine kinase [Gelidibacter sp. F2691]